LVQKSEQAALSAILGEAKLGCRRAIDSSATTATID
jgi:hypothetical protein